MKLADTALHQRVQPDDPGKQLRIARTEGAASDNPTSFVEHDAIPMIIDEIHSRQSYRVRSKSWSTLIPRPG